MSEHPRQNPSGYVTVRDRDLSLWQSSVMETLMTDPPDGSAPCKSAHEARAHRVMAGVNRHVKIASGGGTVPPPDAGPAASADDTNLHAYLSALHFQMARARLNGDQTLLTGVSGNCRAYATCDTSGWISCETTWIQYAKSTHFTLQYNDWTIQGSGNLNYGVIDWTLPDDAVVAIIGDWGTGLPDAEAIISQLMAMQKPPDAIIHLGDIYFSGTPTECASNFSGVMAQLAPGIPVFTIPGNHDYYDWGVGFYQMIGILNSGNQVQQASYFCLRTADNLWQFLAADTGHGDTDPAKEFKTASGPELQKNEITWHQDKLTNFGGATILLSHHQFFSATDTINTTPFYSEYPAYLNMHLGEVFAPFFHKIAAWIWGHEHNIAQYTNNLFGLMRGRLVGSSAYEEAVSDQPYLVRYPQVPFNPAIEFPAQGGYYPHAFALIDFTRAQPSDPVSITYYQTPAWYTTVPSPLPPPTVILSEKIGLP